MLTHHPLEKCLRASKPQFLSKLPSKHLVRVLCFFFNGINFYLWYNNVPHLYCAWALIWTLSRPAYFFAVFSCFALFHFRVLFPASIILHVSFLPCSAHIAVPDEQLIFIPAAPASTSIELETLSTLEHLNLYFAVLLSFSEISASIYRDVQILFTLRHKELDSKLFSKQARSSEEGGNTAVASSYWKLNSTWRTLCSSFIRRNSFNGSRYLM